MIEPTYSPEERLEAAELTIPCAHGWQGPHCVRDDEGSCPFDRDRDNPAADCRCDEAVRVTGAAEILATLSGRPVAVLGGVEG